MAAPADALSPRAHLTLLLAAGVMLAAAFLGVRALGDLAAHVHALWFILALALAGWGLAAWLVWRQPEAAGRHTGPVLIAAAVVFRLLLLDTAPSLSDDIYRYLWDGRVAAAGINPYAQAPDDAAVAPLRDADWERINHRELVTVYPPVAQALFLVAHHVAPGAIGMKGFLVLCDLGLLAVLWRWLRDRGQNPHRVVLYAWHPLPVLEIAGSGHVDVLAILWLCAALWALEAGRRHLAVGALALGALAKVIPLVCLPVFWQRWTPSLGAVWQRRVDPRPRWPLLGLPVAAIAAWWPFRGAGDAMWIGLRAYAGKWRFNDSAYGLLYELLADPLPGWTWDDDALLTARWICLGALAATGLVVALGRRIDPARAAATLLGAQLLLAPTVHPWYVLWLLPFAVLRPEPAWLAFSWLVLLAYQVLAGFQATGIWQEETWVRWLQYGPVYGLLLAPPAQRWLRRRRRDRRRAPERRQARDV